MRGRILNAPYEDRDSCVLNAMLVDGTLYLEEHSPDAKLAEKYIYLLRSMRDCLTCLAEKIYQQDNDSRCITDTRLSPGAHLPVLVFPSEYMVIL